jgi:DNA-binding NtrC family response regulator
MRRVWARIAQLAPLPWPVRVEGPTGSGKEITARLLHNLSLRHDGPYHQCNLNALTDDLALGVLCGHVRGAFTGAVADHAGAFESAHGGTLFLDELGTASAAVQLKLLQVIEDKQVQRLGDHRPRPVDVRLVFATNADLKACVRGGTFRPDLYFRLGELLLTMPALAEHLEDIPELVSHLLGLRAAEVALPVPLLTEAQLEQLRSYSWPGNVRQLNNYLICYLVEATFPPFEEEATTQGRWRERLNGALARHQGNKAAAARELGRSRTTIYRELRQRGA